MKIIYSEIFLEHNKNNDHPENPERIEDLVLELKRYGKPDDVIEAKNGEKLLELAHSKEYIDKVIRLSREGGGDLSPDTFIDETSYKVACYAVGASIKAAKLTLKNENAFALVRPPGHHAHSDWSHGFCIFNNMAIAAIYLQRKGKRVAIIDVDAHLGDGTADITRSYDDIFYVSSHQEGIFPFDDKYDSYTNEHMEPGTSGENFIKSYWKRMLSSFTAFKPDIIGLSLGTDAHIDDNVEGMIGGLNLGFTYETYTAIKKDLDKLGLPYFVVLEGGYNPEVLYECFHIFTD